MSPGPSALETSAADRGGFPSEGLPEVALLGRSNVGKSSLLNRLVGRRRLARTSSTPGKTRLVHFFRVRRPRGELLLVDLPGYGYARVSRAERARWKTLVERYLGDRAPLRLAVLLQDIRRDPTEDETLLVAWLREREVPVVMALTKADKLKRMRRGERVRVLREALAPLGVPVVPTSAETGLGIEELWELVERHAFGAAEPAGDGAAADVGGMPSTGPPSGTAGA